MKAASIICVVLVFWAQESHQQSQGDLAFQKIAEEFTFNVDPPKKDQALAENSTASGEDLNVTANAVAGYDDFWNDKMIQAINQVNEVLLYTVPDFQTKIDETYNIVLRMIKLNKDRLEDAQIVFSESTKPYRIALEICVNVKNLPTYNSTLDRSKQWVDEALNETSLQLPSILNGTDKLQSEAQIALNFLQSTLKGFTADKLRRSCYPNVRCATTQLSKLKDLIFEKRDIIIRCLNVFLGLSINLDSAMYVTISLMKNKIGEESRAAGLALLQANGITKTEINNYFIRYHMTQNQYNLYVQSQLNKTLNCIYEYDYRNIRCKNMTRNAIFSSGYPVVDAYNTVNLLGRNRNGKVLGNEVVDTSNKIQNLSKVMTPLAPNYQKDIALFFDQANNFNTTIYERTSYYFTVTLATDFEGDLIKWYVFLDSKSRTIDLTFLDFVSKNLEHLLQNCTAKVMYSTLDYNKWLGGTLPAEIDQFHLTNLEPVGEDLYNRGNLTHKDIFYFGSVNLNATYRTWKPKLEEAITNVNKTYEFIIKKNYLSYDIYQALYDIVAQYVFTTFERTKGYFNETLVARLNRTAVAQLVQIPSEEYLRLVKDSAVEIERNFNKTFKYLPLNAFIRDELDAYLRKGIQSYSYHRSPRVEHSHVLSGKVYQMKVNYTVYIDQINYLRLDMESIDQGLDAYGETMKIKIKSVCEEYSKLIQSYADAIASGQPFVGTLPSSFQIFARHFREMHLTADAEANPLAQIIDLSIFGF